MARFQVVLENSFPLNGIPLVESKEYGVVNIKSSGIIYDQSVETPVTVADARFGFISYPLTSLTQAGDGSITLPATGNVFTVPITQSITDITLSSEDYIYIILDADAPGYTLDLTGQGYYTEGGIATFPLSAGINILAFSTINGVTVAKFKGGFS